MQSDADMSPMDTQARRLFLALAEIARLGPDSIIPYVDEVSDAVDAMRSLYATAAQHVTEKESEIEALKAEIRALAVALRALKPKAEDAAPLVLAYADVALSLPEAERQLAEAESMAGREALETVRITAEEFKAMSEDEHGD